MLETEGVDPEAIRARIDERRERLRAEVKGEEARQRGLHRQGPADVVDAERSKLEAYRAELEELGGAES